MLSATFAEIWCPTERRRVSSSQRLESCVKHWKYQYIVFFCYCYFVVVDFLFAYLFKSFLCFLSLGHSFVHSVLLLFSLRFLVFLSSNLLLLFLLLVYRYCFLSVVHVKMKEGRTTERLVWCCCSLRGYNRRQDLMQSVSDWWERRRA